MQLWMPCFKKRSDKPDFMSSTVTLMATKHSIRAGARKWKRRRDICDYLEVCHEVRGSGSVNAALVGEKPGWTMMLKIQGGWFPYNTREKSLLSCVSLVGYYHKRNLFLPPVSSQLCSAERECGRSDSVPVSEPRPQEALQLFMLWLFPEPWNQE